MFTENLTQSTPGFNITCVPYGYTFTALATFTVERRYIQFYEGATLVKEIRHIDFEGRCIAPTTSRRRSRTRARPAPCIRWRTSSCTPASSGTATTTGAG